MVGDVQAPRRFEAVIEAILSLVEARGLQPGDALPTERELAETLSASRSVIRQAFGVLEERGLLRSIRGSGRYLREAAAGGADSRERIEIASIADLLEARTLLEVEVAALACERRTTEQAGDLLALAERLTVWEDNLAFHCAIAAATQNFMLERLVSQHVELAGELHQRERYEDAGELSRMRAEHQAVAEAIAARDSDLARDLMRAHLRRTRRLLAAPASAPR
jgi:GntR family transcriptional regulator, transcriptional repressor for pyruvate dehydrogenase complex